MSKNVKLSILKSQTLDAEVSRFPKHNLQEAKIQLQQVIRKANRMLSFITRGNESKSRKYMFQLYSIGH